MKNKLPTIREYQQYLNIASMRYNITIDECRNKFGLYTAKEWLELLNKQL